MDTDRFDALLRSLSVIPSRRAAMRLLALSALAALFDPGETDAARAARRHPHGSPHHRDRLRTQGKKHKKKKKKKTPSPPAPPATVSCAQICGGCCDGNGFCQPGSTLANCGTGGATCDICTGEELCTNSACAPPACGAGGPCRVFVTSTTYKGNLGGLSGADQKCQARAQAAGLPGTYQAWLSDNTNSPSTRFVQSTGPYRLVTGATVANNWTDLTNGTLAVPISLTELSAPVAAGDYAWTSTVPNGAGAGGTNCVNWTYSDSFPSQYGLLGHPTANDANWTQDTGFVAVACDYPVRLYCIQQS